LKVSRRHLGKHFPAALGPLTMYEAGRFFNVRGAVARFFDVRGVVARREFTAGKPFM